MRVVAKLELCPLFKIKIYYFYYQIENANMCDNETKVNTNNDQNAEKVFLIKNIEDIECDFDIVVV